MAVDGETCKINGFTDVAESTGRGKVELIKAKCYKSLLEKPEVLQKLAAACRAVEELKDGA